MECIQGCRIGWPSNELNVYRTIGRMSTQGHVLRILDRSAVASPRRPRVGTTDIPTPLRQPHPPYSQTNQRTYRGRHQQSPHTPSQDLAYRPPEGVHRDIECARKCSGTHPALAYSPYHSPISVNPYAPGKPSGCR